MSLWLRHPAYAPTRDRLISDLRSGTYRFRILAPVLFLCGGYKSARRDSVRAYLQRRYGHALQLFYAETVWDLIAARAERDALSMEADLAALADMVLIIVESAGTFTELGAFSLSEPLRRKLLPIVDTKYETSRSFISTGPLSWIDAESSFGPTIYTALSQVLTAAQTIEERIERIDKQRPVRVQDLADSPKHLVFFIADLVALIFPATIDQVAFYLDAIAPSISARGINVATLVGLATAMGLLLRKSIDIEGRGTEFFIPAQAAALARPFHRRRLLDLPSRRAEHVAALLTIPAAQYVLGRLSA